MSTTPLQLARDQAVISHCLADAIEHSGLEHLCGATALPSPSVVIDLSAIRGAAARAKREASAARARAAALRLIVEARCESSARRAPRGR